MTNPAFPASNPRPASPETDESNQIPTQIDREDQPQMKRRPEDLYERLDRAEAARDQLREDSKRLRRIEVAAAAVCEGLVPGRVVPGNPRLGTAIRELRSALRAVPPEDSTP